MRRTMMIALAAGLTLCAGLILSAKAEDYGPFKTMASAGGEVLTDAKGMPLYTFAKDKKPGDMMGDNMKGVWHVVKAE